MATIKVKLRQSTVPGKAGTIYYQLTHRREIRQITTSIRLYPGEWNAAAEQVADSVDSMTLIQNRIDSDRMLLLRIIRQLDDSGKPYGVGNIVRLFESPDCRVLAFMHKQIVQLQECNRLGTAKNYERAYSSFAQYLRGEDLPFTSMTELLIDSYNAYLIRRGIVRNSISFYMRILRAVYNKAVRLRLVEQTYPFHNVYTGIDRTRKRAVDEQMIGQLNKLELSAGSALALARDLFIFSYFTRGMAFVDVAYLKKSDIQDGTIRYTRRKTGQQLCIRIEPGIKSIIDRYADASSTYLFPILTTEEPAQAYDQYQAAINNHNRMLCKLSKMLPDECRLTSYTSRHSWATTARNYNVPISVISAGLGHASEYTTQIYLTMLENSVIDAANRSIISNLVKISKEEIAGQ